MNSKTISSIAIILSILSVIFTVVAPRGIPLGNYTEGYWDSAEGYYVDGTAIIDGSGNVDGAVTSGSASTFASTIDVDGAATLASAVIEAGATIATTLTVSGETNADTLIFGGDVFATSSLVAATLSAAEVCNNSVIQATPSASFTLTLPATSTLYADCIPTAGDTKVMTIENATSGTANVTIAAGTGGVLLEEGAGGDVVLAQDEYALLIITNVSSSEYLATIFTLRDAD